MKKIAFFVEGQTERILIEKLIENFFSYPDYDIKSSQLIGDRLRIVRKPYKKDATEYFFFIFDVMGDGLLSAIVERSNGLFIKGYSKIFGIRDLFPKKRDEKRTILSLINKKLKEQDNYNNIFVIISVMEIEAWFLIDTKLFERINPILAPRYIFDKLNIDLTIQDTEKYSHPAETINKILSLIGEKYNKKEKQTYAIAHRLDYTKLICDDNMRNSNESYKLFIELFEGISKS